MINLWQNAYVFEQKIAFLKPANSKLNVKKSSCLLYA